MLVWSRKEIFVGSRSEQRFQDFRGCAEKRDWPVRGSMGGVLARLRYHHHHRFIVRFPIGLDIPRITLPFKEC